MEEWVPLNCNKFQHKKCCWKIKLSVKCTAPAVPTQGAIPEEGGYLKKKQPKVI